jgi:hypothetical protein
VNASFDIDELQSGSSLGVDHYWPFDINFSGSSFDEEYISFNKEINSSATSTICVVQAAYGHRPLSMRIL